MAISKEKIEKMLDTEVDKVEEEEDSIKVHIPKDKVGKAIGYEGSNVKAAEFALDKKIEIVEV